MNRELAAAGAASIRPGAGARAGLMGWLAALLLAVTSPSAISTGPDATPFLMGTDQDETTLAGKWYRRIYGEAFRRLGVPMVVVVSPTARLTLMANEGELHGQVSRLATYAEANPNQTRVGEVVHELRLALYGFATTAKANPPKHVDDLKSGQWLVDYRRGIALCEKILKPLVPAALLSTVTSTKQGMDKLRAGHTSLYCDFDIAIQSELLTPGFKGATEFVPALDLGLTLPSHPYLHKSRAELAPKLAATLKQMKAEGLLDRYLGEARRELEAAR